MNFDQGNFDFDAPGSEAGYQKWQQQLDENKRAFELRHGIVLGRRVKVWLTGGTLPLEGMIHLSPQKDRQVTSKLRLLMGCREFSPMEIESIVCIDAESALD